jgi:chromosome segregation ATPase
VLYGVTMQEAGVSKLVSVSWEQARAAAASHAA